MSKAIVATIAVAAALAVGVMASEKPTPAFQQAMKDNGAAMQKLTKDAEAKDYAAIAAAAVILKNNFKGPVDKFFTDAKMTDALQLSAAAYQAAESLEKAANAKDEMALGEARKAVGASCGACHTAHREKLPDGSFAVK